MRSLDELDPNPPPDQALTAGRPAPTLPAAAGAPRLDGVRLAVKDLVAVEGEPLRAGTRARAEAPREPRDAAVVARLRAAGARVTGTVALHEIAFGTTGINDQVGFPPHPHDPTRIPGGSSSGSAVAVARGDCDLAIGTDTGGSVRNPAALCGVVGFKPSYDRYPRDGVLALSPSLDHVGLLAPGVAGIVAAHRVLTGDVVSRLTRPGRLGVDRTAATVASEPVRTAIGDALRAVELAGWALVDVASPARERIHEVTTTIMFAEAATVHRTLLDEHADELGPDVLDRLRLGADITPAAYREALTEAAALRAEVAAVLGTVDAVVGPTVPVVAPTIEATRADRTMPALLVSNTRLGNVTGFPAISVPVAAAGLPVGLQVMATTDVQTLAVAGAIADVVAGTAA